MRIAALFCGLFAGLFALLAPAGLGSDLLTPFLKLWGAAPGQRLLGAVIWYAPAGAAILGGLLAFVAPGLGALLLLGAGIGWVGFSAFDPALFRLELLLPGALALAAAMLAFVAGELELRRRRAARRHRREMLREDAERSDDEERAREAAFSRDPLTVAREDVPPRPSREIPLTLEDVVPVETREPRRRIENIWPDAPGRRSPSGRETDDFAPRRSLFSRAARADHPAPERSERPRRERDSYDDEPAPRRNLFAWLAAANVLVLIGLGVAVGYIMVERAPVPGNAGAVATVPSEPPEATRVPAPAVAAAAPAEAADERLTPNLLPTLPPPGSEPAGIPELPMPPAEPPLVASAEPAGGPTGGTFDDPFAYCNAVTTIDYVDSRYTGPRLTAAIAEALRVPLQSAPDRVRWRCVDGAVYACASFDWPVCAMTPTVQEMLDYCQSHPGTARLLAPNGTWSCEGTRPRLPEGASWPVDARGFFPKAWIPVLPPQELAD